MKHVESKGVGGLGGMHDTVPYRRVQIFFFDNE